MENNCLLPGNVELENNKTIKRQSSDGGQRNVKPGSYYVIYVSTEDNFLMGR
jgi:hypothetical protein